MNSSLTMHTSESQSGNNEPWSHYYSLAVYWFVIRLINIDKLLPVLVSSKVGGTHLRRVRSAVVNRKFQGGTREKRKYKCSAQESRNKGKIEGWTRI